MLLTGAMPVPTAAGIGASLRRIIHQSSARTVMGNRAKVGGRSKRMPTLQISEGRVRWLY
jgi:hypothetical protein